jgi:hypothetical protein
METTKVKWSAERESEAYQAYRKATRAYRYAEDAVENAKDSLEAAMKERDRTSRVEQVALGEFNRAAGLPYWDAERCEMVESDVQREEPAPADR